MFDIALFIAVVVLIAIYTALWRSYKRERDTTNRMAGSTKRAGCHVASDRPTMKWRG